MFTDRYVQSLKPREKDYQVREGKGFTIRILPSGAKLFYYIFKLKGKRYRHFLGTYSKTGLSLSDLREKYLSAAQLVIKGHNPTITSVDNLPSEYLVADLIKDYLVHMEKSNRAASYIKTARLTLENDVLPDLGKMPVINVKRSNAISLVEKVAERAPAQGEGVLKFARAMFSYALHRELCEYNPFSEVSTAVPAAKSKEGERVLFDVEIQHFWKEMQRQDGIGTPNTRTALMLLLVTGQRPVEVATIAIPEVNAEWSTIPAEKAKNRSDHRVFLTPLARRLLPTPICQWYFPSPDLNDDGSIAGPIARKALSDLITKKPIGKKGDVKRLPYLGLTRWTPQDLRRTVATKLSEMGCRDEIVDAILNHRKKGVIRVYNRNKYDKEKRKWLTKWAEYLEALVK